MSARLHSFFRYSVLVWQMVTVAFSRSISIASGLPTILERPTITQLFLQHVVDYTKDMGEITVIRH